MTDAINKFLVFLALLNGGHYEYTNQITLRHVTVRIQSYERFGCRNTWAEIVSEKPIDAHFITL